MSNVITDRHGDGAAESERQNVVEPLIPGHASSPHDDRATRMARCTVLLGKQAEIALAEVGISDAQYRMLSCSATDDRRRVELSLTEAGTALLLAADDAVAERLKYIASFAVDQDRTEASFDALAWWSDGLQRMTATLAP